MQFKQGTEVYTADGQKVGVVDQVVLDPVTKHVTHLVVRKGFIFVEDRLVPMELIDQTSEDRITLVRRVDDLDDLPFYEEAQYIPVEEARPGETGTIGYAPPVYWYPPVGAAWGAAPGYVPPLDQDYVIQTKRNIPEDKVALKEGAKVTASDGKQVGEIERVYTDTHTDEATHFLIAKGMFLKERKLVPTSWASKIAEDEVQLAVSSDLIDQLREFTE